MIALADFTGIMASFLDQSLDASAFITRYIALRNEVVEEQNRAIRRNPSVSAELNTLHQLQGQGAISSDDYLHAVQAQYTHLQGLSLPPGSPADAILQQLFVEIDAYGQFPADGQLFNEQDLREAVFDALRQLQMD